MQFIQQNHRTWIISWQHNVKNVTFQCSPDCSLMPVSAYSPDSLLLCRDPAKQRCKVLWHHYTNPWCNFHRYFVADSNISGYPLLSRVQRLMSAGYGGARCKPLDHQLLMKRFLGGYLHKRKRDRGPASAPPFVCYLTKRSYWPTSV